MYEYKIKSVTNIVDGDTFDCLVDLGFGIFHNIRVQLEGIDAPETRTKDIEEKAKGLKSKENLESLLEDEYNLVLKTSKKDGFGRWSGTVVIRYEDQDFDLNINTLMVRTGFAE